MVTRISSQVSISDIPLLMRLDRSVYQKSFAPIVSALQYKEWISTEGTWVTLARSDQQIIGQRWMHPVQIYHNQRPLNKKIYWIHNTKVHPMWQNKGIYQKLVDFDHKASNPKNNQYLNLLSTTNHKMRYLIKKVGFIPLLNPQITVLFRNLFICWSTKKVPLQVKKSKSPPQSWLDNMFEQEIYWIPKFSWDPSPYWFSFYFKDKLVCVLQMTYPIHPVYGRVIKSINFSLRMVLIRYLSLCTIDNFPSSLFRSVFHLLFQIYSKINIILLFMLPQVLVKKLQLPSFLLPTRNFTLYSTKSDQNLLNDDLGFQMDIIPI
ncbi:MAG: hypothetical protein ACFFBD_29015 [Candidatus Hodarchaeota archaeon]